MRVDDFLRGGDAEVRAGSSGGVMVEGYAVVFNKPTVIAGIFREVIKPGAFTNTLRDPIEGGITALWNHNDDVLLGRTSNGTLQLRQDGHGLHFNLELDPDSPDGARAIAAVTRGDVTQMSFALWSIQEDWTDLDSDLPLRSVEEIVLQEISLVPRPAYPTTTVQLKNRSRSVVDHDHATRTHNFLNASRRKAEAAMRQRGIRI